MKSGTMTNLTFEQKKSHVSKTRQANYMASMKLEGIDGTPWTDQHGIDNKTEKELILDRYHSCHQ